MPTLTTSALIPCLRYQHAPAAIVWLCETFGFERHLVIPGVGDEIAHAQLVLGGGMLMVGSVKETPHGRLMRQPYEVGGISTQSLHVVTADPDAIYERARAAGASIEVPIKDEDFGGRSFTCRDLEGHLWSFGSYDPWRID